MSQTMFEFMSGCKWRSLQLEEAKPWVNLHFHNVPTHNYVWADIRVLLVHNKNYDSDICL